MADLYKPWGKGLQFSASNDLRLATDVEYARQRIIHALLNGPVETDANGVVVVPADNLFAQDWGAGLGRDVNGVNDWRTKESQEARIKTTLSKEPSIDQTKPITVEFRRDDERNVEYVAIKCTTLDGNPVVTMFQN